MAKILIVDDEKSIRNTFKIFLSKEGHDVLLAEDAKVAIKISNEQDLDLIITDNIMPIMTGIELLSAIKAEKPDIPIIIMTGKPTIETAKEALKNDANDYLVKPVSKEDLLKVAKYSLEKRKLIEEREKLGIENTERHANLENLDKIRTAALQEVIKDAIETIVKTLEQKDLYASNYRRRVGAISLVIAYKMRLSEDEMKRIYFVGCIHDIAKILKPSKIFAKPGKLAEGESGVIKEHVESLYDLVRDIELSWPIADLIFQHHERMDGSGYPNGLKNDEIQLGARILAVADVIEAMTAHKPLKPGFGIEIALEEIKSKAGKLYDNEVSMAAIELIEAFNCNFVDIHPSQHN